MSDRKAKTLFVDDSFSASRIAQKGYGDVCELEVTADIPAAMERVAADAFELVIVDYLLPSGSGIELIRVLRGMEAYDNIPVILISSSLTNQVAFGAMRAGANVSISKMNPISETRQEILLQLERPYTKLIVPDVLETCCLAWKSDNVFYQYSPEIDQVAVAATAEGAHQKIEELLREGYKKSRNIKLFTYDMSLKRHLIPLSGLIDESD